MRIVLLILFLMVSNLALAESRDQTLLDLGLEDLMNLEVFSAAKKKRPLSASANAVTVITAEDIRRSGATHIGELLRHAPGIHAARLNAFDWRISARGSYNAVYPNKLLVLIDGRSVYNAQLSTVFWDVINPPLETIERIEVIRGPGGTLWGANAVNGVINILTQPASNLSGTWMHADGGKQIQSLRLYHGDELHPHRHVRVHGQALRRDNSAHALAEDGQLWRQGGFTLQERPSAQRKFLLQGEVYNGHVDELDWSDLRPGATRQRGGHLLARWQTGMGTDAAHTIQAYYDHTQWQRPTYGVTNQVLDLEWQHRRALGRHELLLGMGFRRLNSEVPPDSRIQRFESLHRDNTYSAFLQDEVELLPDRMHLIVGVKFEHNGYTGFNWQPNLRLLWMPRPDLTLWSALSRAVQIPSQVADHIDFSMPLPADLNPFDPLPLYSHLHGNPDLDNETVVTAEAGARGRLGTGWSWDFAAFFSHYRDIRILLTNPRADGENQRIVLDGYYYNGMEADSLGAEFALDWRRGPWRARLALSAMKIERKLYPQYADRLSTFGEDNPNRLASLQLGRSLGKNWEVNWWVRHVGGFEGLGKVAPFTATDVKLTWRPQTNLELSLVGENLFDPGHYEYLRTDFYPHIAEIPRSLYLRLAWRLD